MRVRMKVNLSDNSDTIRIDPSKAWIQTARGTAFHILDPQPDEIDIRDIAASLSKLCRFTGHVKKFYSVAEHCVHCSYLTPKRDAFWALMHDTPEAYIADINRPLKHFTAAGPAYIEIEKKIMAVIASKFGLSMPEPESVKIADNMMLYTEKDQLMYPLSWDVKWGDATQKANLKIPCWSPDVAEISFLHRFYELTNQF